MSKLIRKISIGKDYKNDAMHYAVGQEVYGGHTICAWTWMSAPTPSAWPQPERPLPTPFWSSKMWT